MSDLYIGNILEITGLNDDLSLALEDALRRNLCIDAECPLDLSSLQDCPIDFPFS
jgi:hypothetical protein